MNINRYKPKIDKYFYFIWIPLATLLIAGTILSTISIPALIILLCTDVLTFYFMVSSLVAYVELRENTLFIKFGCILKREIPYDKIIDIKKDRRVITYSMLAIKNSLEHIDIKYNKYDFVTVSVKDNDKFIKDLKSKMNSKTNEI